MSGFSHPNHGKEVRVEQRGREVRLIFVAGSSWQASELMDELTNQLKAGTLNITLMGKPTSVEESSS